MFLDLSSKSSDFAILLLDDRVEPFALLHKNLNFVLALSSQSLYCGIILGKLLSQLIVLATNYLEFILKFAQLTRRKAKVFLCTPYFLSQTGIFTKKLLNSLLVAFRLLSSGAKSVPEIIEFGSQSLCLSC